MELSDLGNACDLINLFADDKTKEDFPLYDILYDIGIKILDYRIKSGMSHEELAKLLEIEIASVIQFEDCEYNPTIEELWRIHKKTGLNFDLKIGADEHG